MKTYNKLFQLACMAVLMGAATGCTDEALVEQTGTDKPIVPNNQLITVKASVPDGSSRIAYNESESKLTMTWEAADAFTVLRKSHLDNPTVFTIEEGTEGENYASFTGTPNEVWENGDVLYAVYPKSYVIDPESNSYPLYDLSEQNGKLGNEKQYMYATTTYQVGKTPEFKFQNLTSLLKLTMKFPEGVTKINEIVVKDTQPGLYSCKGLNITAGLLYPADYEKMQYRITADDLVVSDGTLTVYVYMFGAKKTYPAVIATDANGNQYANSFKGREIVESKMYRAAADMIPIVPFQGGEGTKENPFQIANLAQWNSLAALTAANMNATADLKYAACHYVMTNDIALSSHNVVYSIGGHTGSGCEFAGTFDGQDHEFTGVLNLSGTNHENIGLFSNVSWGKIHNLHLNTTAGTVYDPSGAFGGMVGMVEQAEIWGCSNTMSVHLQKAKYVGGIVGSNIRDLSNWNSTIDGCWYSGDLATEHEESYVGGIAGSLTKDVQTRACYTSGCVSGSTVGGIVGAMYEATITLGCWSNMALNGYAIGGVVGHMAEGDDYTRNGIYIYHCYYSANAELYGTSSSSYEDCYFIENCGKLDGENLPSADQIAAMNAQLKDNSFDDMYRPTSTYKFNEYGEPVQSKKEEGNTNGSNFGNGGEF